MKILWLFNHGSHGDGTDGIFTECQWPPQGRIQAGSTGFIPHWDVVFWESLNKPEYSCLSPLYVYTGPWRDKGLLWICLLFWGFLHLMLLWPLQKWQMRPQVLGNEWLVVILLPSNPENEHWKVIKASIARCMLIANEKWSTAGSHLMLHLAHVPPQTPKS